MKLASFVVATALSLSGAAFAQTPTTDHSPHRLPSTSSAAAPTSEGLVRKIDGAHGKVTLKHAPIANLDMPGMTMVFKVADPRMLDNLSPGDKVKFAATNKDGVITVTAIETAK